MSIQAVELVSFFDLEDAKRERQEKPETLVDALLEKHGAGSISLGYQENKEIGVKRGKGR